MYVIAKGECSVLFIDEARRPIKNKKYLRVGELFGEISMVYGCKRTATVISNKYTTLGVLKKERYKEIATEFPEIVGYFKEGIFKYRDRVKIFLMHMIERVDYF